MAPKVSVIVPVYRAEEYLERCVGSLRGQTLEELEIILVDDGSPDGCPALCDRYAAGDDRVTVRCLPENVGFGRGHNSVMKDLHSDVHFILNPDVLLQDDVLTGMAAWLMEHPGVVMATPQLYFPDGRIQHLPRRKPTPWLLLARQLADRMPGGVFAKANEHYTMQDEDLSAPRPIEFCTGSFAALRTDVFKKIGGFDPEYFMYVEDADLTQKALQCGQVYLLPQFRAVHAWHRAPMRDACKFKMQLVSMGRYFRKWGCGRGKV